MRSLSTKRFGKLTVIKLHEIRKYKSARNTQTKAYWLCRCDCGNMKVVRGEHLIAGKIVSCGCVNKQNARLRLLTHGLTGSPEYNSWLSMWSRVREARRGNP